MKTAAAFTTHDTTNHQFLLMLRPTLGVNAAEAFWASSGVKERGRMEG
jgi:hypothetical protein